MVRSGGQSKPTNRREFIQIATAAGLFGVVSEGVAAQPERGQTDSSGSAGTDTTQLGDFETGLDGWNTTGRTSLTRASADELSSGVSAGEHALVVELNGDSFPMIENQNRVRQADFQQYPHILMHVLALVRQTDADLRITFRLHHTPGSGGRGSSASANNARQGSRGSPRSRDVNVVESEIKTIPQATPTQVHWDMSDISDQTLESANRLEIVWYPVDHEPNTGHRGQNSSGLEMEGYVAFDDIKLTESDPLSPEERRQQLITRLRREHGRLTERQTAEHEDDFERGTLVYQDGFSIEYSFEIVGSEKYISTIGGESFQLGGGWA